MKMFKLKIKQDTKNKVQDIKDKVTILIFLYYLSICHPLQGGCKEEKMKKVFTEIQQEYQIHIWK